MSDETPPEQDPTVQLQPEEANAEPKLAVVTPGPRNVTVKVPAAVAVPKDPAAAAPVAGDGAGDDVSDVIKKGVLLDEVVAATGVKRADAKAVSEALFAALAAHLQAGRDLQLPPLGKIRTVNEKDVGQGAKALTVKIRTPNTD